MKRITLAFATSSFALFLTGCSNSGHPAGTEKRYPMTGEVMSLNAKDQTATIKANPIKGWMDAMTMEFPIKSKSDFNSLRVGEKISATVDVEDGVTYSLADVKPENLNK